MENTVVPDGVWSGGAALDVNGVPVLFFTAGNDSFAEDGLISNQNIGAAYPADLSDPELIDWVVCADLAIAQLPGQGRPGEFRDSHIWKEDDTWYMLICSGSETSHGGSALLYETRTLEVKGDGVIDMDWVYRGPVYDWPDQSMTYGTSWELPILLPLTNEAGTITKYFFSISPAPASMADNKVYYFVGDFDGETGKFIPDERFIDGPALLDYGSNVFTGPSALVDPVSGDVYLFSIMQDQRGGAEEGTISGKNPNKAKEAKKPFVSGPLEVGDGELTIEVYIDRSLVEGFFNDSKSISMRSYSDFESQGLSLEADGEIMVEELYVAEVNSIYK